MFTLKVLLGAGDKLGWSSSKWEAFKVTDDGMYGQYGIYCKF